MFPPAFNSRDLPRFADIGREKKRLDERCRGVADTLRLLCDQVCRCVATKCVITLPSPVPSAVEKFLNPVRRRASYMKLSPYALKNHAFNRNATVGQLTSNISNCQLRTALEEHNPYSL
jgi:hypothetical protein